MLAIFNGMFMLASRLFAAPKINWKRAVFSIHFVHMEETRPFWVRICIFAWKISLKQHICTRAKVQKVREDKKISKLPGNPYSSEFGFGIMHLPVFIAPKLINKSRAETETVAFAGAKSRLGWAFATLETYEWFVVPFNGIQSLYISYPNAPCRKYLPTLPLECRHVSPNVSK